MGTTPASPRQREPAVGPRGTVDVTLGPVPGVPAAEMFCVPCVQPHPTLPPSFLNTHPSERGKSNQGDWLASRPCRWAPCHFYGKKKALFLLPPTLAPFRLHGGLDAITVVSYGPFMFPGADNPYIS